MICIVTISDALTILNQGKILAYPTEAVYGLGCCPFDQKAVGHLASLKGRSLDQGFILLISDWTQLDPLIQVQPSFVMDRVRATWPGPVTWIFPKSEIVPDWISGKHGGVAIRMTAHPIARALCSVGPIVSTSANRSGMTPAVDERSIRAQFSEGIDACLVGDLGGALQPSEIHDLLTGKQVR